VNFPPTRWLIFAFSPESDWCFFARRLAVVAKKQKADRYSANLLPVIRDIQRSGIKSLRGVARALTARGIPRARGGVWTPVQVSAILERAK
jgi:Recombinase